MHFPNSNSSCEWSGRSSLRWRRWRTRAAATACTRCAAPGATWPTALPGQPPTSHISTMTKRERKMPTGITAEVQPAIETVVVVVAAVRNPRPNILKWREGLIGSSAPCPVEVAVCLREQGCEGIKHLVRATNRLLRARTLPPRALSPPSHRRTKRVLVRRWPLWEHHPWPLPAPCPPFTLRLLQG